MDGSGISLKLSTRCHACGKLQGRYDTMFNLPLCTPCSRLLRIIEQEDNVTRGSHSGGEDIDG